jgi:hypothetical protein
MPEQTPGFTAILSGGLALGTGLKDVTIRLTDRHGSMMLNPAHGRVSNQSAFDFFKLARAQNRPHR